MRPAYCSPRDPDLVVGSGFRARMLLDVARVLGTVRCSGVVVRTPRSLDVPSFTSLDAGVRELRPDFVLTNTRSVTPGVIADAVDRGLPVLAETPPPPIWTACGRCGRRSAPPDSSRWRSST